MKKRLMMILSCLFLSIGLISAQKKVSGSVVDDMGDPIISASVVVKGTTVGVATDLDGNFTINVPEGKKILSFHLVGMKTLEKEALDGMRVVMEEDLAMLEEIIVTGYGNHKRSSFTGSASVLSTKGLDNIPSVSLESKLAGAAAGVQLGTSSGQPGAMESIRIRGTGSITASNEPLYVIDGVPMQSANTTKFEYADSGNSVLSTINSNDIASITIIKDAAAAALYGSRAANGVVVITTKQGSAGKTQVSMRADMGFSNMAIDYRPSLNGDDRRALLHAGLVNYQKDMNVPGKEIDPIAYADREIGRYAEKPWSGWADWKDLLTRTGTTQNYEMNVQGGNDKTNFYTSLSYSSNEGVFLGSDYDRVTGRINLSHKASDKLTLSVNALYANTKQKSVSEGSAYASPISAMSMNASAQDYPYNKDGSLNVTSKFANMGGAGAIANPLNTLENDYEITENNRFLGSASAKYDIYNGIYAKQNFSYDFLQTDSKAWWSPGAGNGRLYNGVLQKFAITKDNLISQTHLGYTNTFGGVHNVDGLFGYEIEKFKEKLIYALGEGYANPSKNEIENSERTESDSHYVESRMISYLGLVNYNYDNKYYVSLNFRRDGSSKLARSARWGNFGGAAASWRFTEESFAESFKDVLTAGKIRLSYGINGTLPAKEYEYMNVYKYGHKYNGINGSGEARMADLNLRWEKNHIVNLGVELTFLDRFNFILDLYDRKTKDLLINKQLSRTTGFDKTVMNMGSMSNKGIELTLSSTNIATKDFYWNTSFNIAHNRNKLTKLDGIQTEMTLESQRMRHVVGEAFNTFYLFEYAGVDPKTGKESYYRNVPGHEREITTDHGKAQKILSDKVDPVVHGGLTNTFSYKGIDLGFTFTYSLGGHLYDNAAAVWLGAPGGAKMYYGNIPAYYKQGDIWQKEGDNAKLPRFVYGSTTQLSTRYIKSTDHLRLKNVTLGYNIPKHLLTKMKLSKVRLYTSAVNLLTLKSSNLDIDPEIPVSPVDGSLTYGVVLYQTPPLRTVTFGVEIGF